jgi:transposase
MLVMSTMFSTGRTTTLLALVLDCGLHEIGRQLQYKAAMRGGRIMIADRFYPSTQICSCCGCLTGPKGR